MGEWADAHGLPAAEGRRRVYQHAMICCVAQDPWLRERVAVRGSVALWFAYGHFRSAGDVDITVLPTHGKPNRDVMVEVQRRVVAALTAGMPRRIHDLPRWQDEILREVRTEVRPSYVPVGARWQPLGVGGLSLQFYDLEFILMGKLFGIAHLSRNNPIDMTRLRAYALHRLAFPDHPEARLTATGNELKEWTQGSFEKVCRQPAGQGFALKDWPPQSSRSLVTGAAGISRLAMF